MRSLILSRRKIVIQKVTVVKFGLDNKDKTAMVLNVLESR